MAHCLLSTGNNDRAKQCAQLASEVRFITRGAVTDSYESFSFQQMQENHSVLYLLAKLNFAEGRFDVAENYLEKLLAHPDTNTLDMYVTHGLMLDVRVDAILSVCSLGHLRRAIWPGTTNGTLHPLYA